MVNDVCMTLHYQIHEIVPYINWVYFFHAWGFPPRFAAIADIHGCDVCRATWLASFPVEDRARAAEAMQLHKEALRMLTLLDSRLYRAHVRFGLFPCNSDGEDIIVHSDSECIVHSDSECIVHSAEVHSDTFAGGNPESQQSLCTMHSSTMHSSAMHSSTMHSSTMHLKVVIFSQWERMTRLVAQELERSGVEYTYLHGSIPAAERQQRVETFQTDPSVRVFLSTDAGATGLNLQAANVIINLDSLMFDMEMRTDSSEHMLEDMATYHMWAPMRRMAVGGMHHIFELWEYMERFNCDMVAMYDQLQCKGMQGVHGLFEDEFRKRNIKAFWMPHALPDCRTVSRAEIRRQINDYMTTVMHEEPLDPSLLDFDDSMTW